MKYKSSMIIGFLLFFAFCIISSTELIVSQVLTVSPNTEPIYIVGIIHIIAFVVPTAVLRFTKVGEEGYPTLRIRFFSPPAILFIISVSISLALLSFLLNNLMLTIFPSIAQTDNSMFIWWSKDDFANIIFIIIIQAIVYELFFRGALFSALEHRRSTFIAVSISAIMYALIYGSLYNFLGPLITGFILAMITYWTNSVLPAIFIKIIYNITTILILNLTQMYFLVGFSYYINVIIVLLFLLFTYIWLSRLEGLIEDGKIKTFQKSRISHISALLECLINPGFLAFIFIYFLIAIVGVI